MHKKAAIDYTAYDPETGRVSFLENSDKEDQGTTSQEAVTEGLLDLSVLDNLLEIH